TGVPTGASGRWRSHPAKLSGSVDTRTNPAGGAKLSTIVRLGACVIQGYVGSLAALASVINTARMTAIQIRMARKNYPRSWRICGGHIELGGGHCFPHPSITSCHSRESGNPGQMLRVCPGPPLSRG